MVHLSIPLVEIVSFLPFLTVQHLSCLLQTAFKSAMEYLSPLSPCLQWVSMNAETLSRWTPEHSPLGESLGPPSGTSGFEILQMGKFPFKSILLGENGLFRN